MKKYFFFALLFCIQQSFSQNLTGIWHGSYQYGFRKAHYSYTITLFINLDNKGFLNIHSHKLVKKYNNMDSIVVNKVEILKRKKNKKKCVPDENCSAIGYAWIVTTGSA